jgi:hypothetical protein
MTPEYEQKLVRACLAALARRIDVGLVVAFDDIEREYANDTRLEIACDDDAKCVRITAPELRS